MNRIPALFPQGSTSPPCTQDTGEQQEEAAGAMGGHNPTEVQMSQLVLPCHSNQHGELSAGQLLKWIDTAACLSGKLCLGICSPSVWGACPAWGGKCAG